MPKMKTHSASKKRFRATGGGKLVRNRAFRSHLLEHKSPKRKRHLRKATGVAVDSVREVLRLLGRR